MRNNFNDLTSLEKKLNVIEYQLNRNKGLSKDKFIPNKKENIPRKYPIEDITSNENHIRHIIKSEFIKLFQKEMEIISNSLGKDIYSNKQKIAEIEYKLSFNQPLKESNNNMNNIYNEKRNMINNDNFVKKDEFEIKMKQIKADILGEINNSDNNMNKELNISLNKIKLNENEIKNLKYNYVCIVSQINAMKKDLDKISKNLITSKGSINDENLKINEINYNEINRNVKDLQEKINENKEEIKGLKKNIYEINNNLTNKNETNHKRESFKKEKKGLKVTSINENLDNQNNNLNDERNNNLVNLKKEKYIIKSYNEEVNDKSNKLKDKYIIKSINEEPNDNSNEEYIVKSIGEESDDIDILNGRK